MIWCGYVSGMWLSSSKMLASAFCGNHSLHRGKMNWIKRVTATPKSDLNVSPVFPFHHTVTPHCMNKPHLKKACYRLKNLLMFTSCKCDLSCLGGANELNVAPTLAMHQQATQRQHISAWQHSLPQLLKNGEQKWTSTLERNLLKKYCLGKVFWRTKG